MSLRRTFAVNLRRIRNERGISQEALAHSIGIDRTYLSDLERELYSASLDMVEKLAEGLGVEPYELLKPGRR
jgi:transcriptional regulator with XRE-family HTH domain